ncbi:MAG: GNAT family N-acetyltransferase [Ignavibacteriales bacterium]|nr:GNAT family N-acetyltransferase [Ignavibacteriales bacterium]
MEEGDLPLLLWFINRIAEYEKLPHEVTATVETLKESFFGKKSNVEAYIGYEDGEPIAYAIYFYNFSSFLGKKGMYLEDLFVLPELRGRGIGKKILTFLANRAVEEGCGRFEWAVLDWNKPAIDFYKSVGAVSMDEWTIFRLSGEALNKFANKT